jgi:hypothetical protein
VSAVTPGPVRPTPAVSFASSVRLTKAEAFTLCQALADADRRLVRAGFVEEAGALGDAFELLEDRLVDDGRRQLSPGRAGTRSRAS